MTVDIWPNVCFVRYSTKTYLLLTEFEVRTVSYGPSFFRSDLWPKREARGYKSERKIRGSVTYSTDREDEVSKIFIISLGSKRHFAWRLKQTFKFSGPYSKVKLNQSQGAH